MHCGQNTEFLNVKGGGAYSKSYALKGQVWYVVYEIYIEGKN